MGGSAKREATPWKTRNRPLLGHARASGVDAAGRPPPAIAAAGSQTNHVASHLTVNLLSAASRPTAGPRLSIRTILPQPALRNRSSNAAAPMAATRRMQPPRPDQDRSRWAGHGAFCRCLRGARRCECARVFRQCWRERQSAGKPGRHGRAADREIGPDLERSPRTYFEAADDPYRPLRAGPHSGAANDDLVGIVISKRGGQSDKVPGGSTIGIGLDIL